MRGYLFADETISREDAIVLSDGGPEDQVMSRSSITLKTEETSDRKQVTVKSLHQSLLLVSSGSCVCRICHTANIKEPLISPCR